MLTEVLIEKPIYKGRGAWRIRTVKVTRDGHVYILNKDKTWVEVKSAWKPRAILVLETFVGPRPTPKHECCHRDDDRSNNDVSNLYWGTHADNMRDVANNGLLKGLNKIETDDEAMVAMYNAGSPISEVAKSFGVGHATTYGRLKRKGVVFRRCCCNTKSDLNAEDLQTIIAARDQGYSCAAVARALCLSYKTVYRAFKKVEV